MTAHRFRVVVLDTAGGRSFLDWFRQFDVNLSAWFEATERRDLTILPDNSVTDPATDTPLREIDTGREYWFDEVAYEFNDATEDIASGTFSGEIENLRQNMIGTGVWAFPDDDPRSVEPANGTGFLPSRASDWIYEHSVSFADERRVGAEHAEVIDKFVAGNPPEVL